MRVKLRKTGRAFVWLSAILAACLFLPAARCFAQQGMESMPGMTPSPTPSKSSASAEKCAAPSGSNRARELLSTPMLEAHLKSLGTEPVEDSKIHHFFLFDLLEYRAYSAGPATLTWDFLGWIGGDFNRLWIITEGDQNVGHGNGVEGELQLLYGRLVAPFWDFQAGFRYNGTMGPDSPAVSRGYAVIGFVGLAPGWFEVEPSLYISNRGEVVGEITISADVYITQGLILQPRFESQCSVQGDRNFSTGKGVNYTDLGVRIRYELAREIAPYIGLTWLRKYGETAGIVRAEGEPADAIAFVAGFRLWY